MGEENLNAVKIDLIPTNPADKVERPKKNEFKGSYYSAEEIHALTEVAEGTKLEIPVLLASFYGLRRSEVLGLSLIHISEPTRH